MVAEDWKCKRSGFGFMNSNTQEAGDDEGVEDAEHKSNDDDR
jgi:hypothetical protein